MRVRERDAGMGIRGWATRSVAVWLLAAGALIAATQALFAVLVRDRNWVPGPFSGLVDLVAATAWWIHFGAALLVLFPAYWWRRRGGSGPAAAGLAFAGPLSLVALLALWRGTHGWDGLFLIVVGAAAFALSFVAALAIRIAVRPALQED